MAYAVGVDVGSTQTKAVVLDEDSILIARALCDTGGNPKAAAERAFNAALKCGGIPDEQVTFIVGTGCGRSSVTFSDARITDISCLARAAIHLFPQTRTVLDMGGQDTKAIRIGADGQVIEFAVNDPCKTGAGRFLQSQAETLEIPLSELGPLALRATKRVSINAPCSAIAESEILGWLEKGEKVEDILQGVHYSIGMCGLALLRRVGIAEDVTYAGGVSGNTAMVRVMNELLGFPINVSEESPYVGALGAALFAMDRIAASRTPAVHRGGF